MEAQEAAVLSILNDALVRIGAEPITTIGAGSTDTRVRACRSTWLVEIPAMFGERPWSFASRRAKLERLTEAPNGNWEFVYALPNDLSNINAIYDDKEKTTALTYQFERIGFRIHTNCEELYLNYTAQVPPSQWPAGFRNSAITRLAAVLATRFGGDQSQELRRELRQESDRASLSAVSQDDQGSAGVRYGFGDAVLNRGPGTRFGFVNNGRDS